MSRWMTRSHDDGWTVEHRVTTSGHERWALLPPGSTTPVRWFTTALEADQFLHRVRPVWEDVPGGIDTDAFLAAYAEDDNVFWMTDSGGIQNVLDDLIERLKPKEGA